MRFWEFMCHGHCWLYLNEALTIFRCLATIWSGGATLFPASEISLLFHGPKPINIIQCFSIFLFIITPLRSLFRYFLLASPPHILMPLINCISVCVLYICALYTKRIRFFLLLFYFVLFCLLLSSGNYFCLLGGHIIPTENACIIILFPVPISEWHWGWAQTLSWHTRVQTGNFFDRWWIWEIFYLDGLICAFMLWNCCAYLLSWEKNIMRIKPTHE